MLERIIRALPADFPAPVAICQHMAPGFVQQWAERLDPLSWLSVKQAEDGQLFERGSVYIAPIGRHLRFTREDRAIRMRLDPDTGDAFFCPSIDRMFTSAAEVFGSRALGVLLTGLGTDGAAGMSRLRQAGGYTLAQTPETAVAPSMPAAAVELGAVVEAVPESEIPRVLIERACGRF